MGPESKDNTVPRSGNAIVYYPGSHCPGFSHVIENIHFFLYDLCLVWFSTTIKPSNF